MVDTRAVGDYQGRSVVCLGLLDGVEELHGACADGNLSHIYVAVADGHHAKVFLADLLTGSGELGDCANGRSLGALAAGVRVNLSVKDEDVHILTAGKDVVQTAVTDVVGGTVAAEYPLAA